MTDPENRPAPPASNRKGASVAVIYGNPRDGGFVHGSLDFVAGFLAERGAAVEKVRLRELRMEDCRGCFTCLRTGSCVLRDDLDAVIALLRRADGIVTGASVRNSFFPALYKRFFERITYLLGFTRDLRGKPVLALGAVGIATGKKNLGRLLLFSGFGVVPVSYLFFRTGIPGKLTVEEVSPRLERAASRLLRMLERPARMPICLRLRGALDDFTIRRFMLRKNPDGVYNGLIRIWREKGML